MREIPSGAGKLLFIGALAALAAWASWTLADDSKKDKSRPKDGSKAEKKNGKKKEEEKLPTYEFSMSRQPWTKVIDWLADELNIPFVGTIKPTGTFDFIPPRGKKKFTMPEIIDILNDALIAEKYIIVRRASSFTIVPADEPVPKGFAPRIKTSDLGKYGKNEIVSVLIPLQSLVAEDIKSEVRQTLSGVGDVVAFETANKLLITDKVANIKQIYDTITELEDKEKANSSEVIYKCQYIKARNAMAKVKELLGDPLEIAKQLAPTRFGQQGWWQQPAVQIPKLRMHYITADESRNTVIVTGPANKVAQAKALLEKMDTPRLGQKKVVIGDPFLKTYTVPGGNAEAAVKTLEKRFKSSENLSITAINSTTIAVWGGPQDHIDILKQLEGIKTKSENKLFALSNLDAAKAMEILEKAFPDSKNGKPVLAANTDQNSIFVKGTPEEVEDVRKTLIGLGESSLDAGKNGGSRSPGFRVITLDKGSAASLAEALKNLLPEMLNNPVKVISPTGDNKKEPPKKDEEKEDKQDKDSKDDNTSRRNTGKKTMVWQGLDRKREILLAQAKKSGLLVDPRDDDKKNDSKKHGKKNLPVIITAFGNRFFVKTDDPEAMRLVQEIINLYVKTPAGEGDFEYLPLKNANATDVAKVLDEVFNGARTNTNQQNNPLGFRGLGRSASPGAQNPEPKENRIRVVADTGTNALVVRASPLDMVTIRRMLRQYLDKGAPPDVKTLVRTWPPIKLRYAVAYNVADTIETLHSQEIDRNPSPNQGGRAAFFARLAGNQNVDANGNPRPVTLSITTDDPSNSLIVSCTEGMYKDIKTLAQKLDEYAKDDKKTIKIVRIKGIDPALLQKAIDLIQGRRPRTATSNLSSAFGGGPFGGGGGFGGGRVRFGGGG
jgi:type II secretory pathway component GspD/PulD (secretin)